MSSPRSPTTNTGSLAGRVAIVTGASSGIGAATARAFAAAGAKLVLNGRDAKRLQAVADSITSAGGQAVTFVGPVESEATHKSLVELALSKFGALHIAFNNAGVYLFKPLVESDPAAVDSMLDINVKGIVYALKHQIPAIAKSSTAANWGAIINNSSTVSTRVKAGFSEGGAVYAATKSAVDTLTRIGALEAAKSFVRVNSVNPGLTASEGALGNFGGVASLSGFSATAGLVPQAASTDEIAQTVIFLADNKTGRFFNGANIVQDGGAQVR